MNDIGYSDSFSQQILKTENTITVMKSGLYSLLILKMNPKKMVQMFEKQVH